MVRSLQTEQESLIASLAALVSGGNLFAEAQRRSNRCQAVMQYSMRHFGSMKQTLGGTSARHSALVKRIPHRRFGQYRLLGHKEGCSMSTGVAVSPLRKTWKELYRNALFETDKSRKSERIAHAEWALTLRARELFHSGREHLQERQEVDAALCALQALRKTATPHDVRKGVRTA